MRGSLAHSCNCIAQPDRLERHAHLHFFFFSAASDIFLSKRNAGHVSCQNPASHISVTLKIQLRERVLEFASILSRFLPLWVLVTGTALCIFPSDEPLPESGGRGTATDNQKEMNRSQDTKGKREAALGPTTPDGRF